MQCENDSRMSNTLGVKNSAAELGVCEETVRRLVRRKMLRKSPGADSNSKSRDSTVFGGGGPLLWNHSPKVAQKWLRKNPSLRKYGGPRGI